ASAVAWDARSEEQGGQRWFHLQPDAAGKPDDVLHWTKGAYQWNFMCADCHSTAVQKNYDPVTRSYQTEFAELTVGCEACHGPGSAHLANPTQMLGLTTQEQQLNACAPCHSRRGQLAEGFSPSEPFLNHYLPALLEEGLYHADGQILDEVYVYGSFLQSKMHQRGVSCSDCHDVHSGELHLEGNAVCTQCHNASGRADYPTLPLADFDNPSHHFHEADTTGAQCVNCHMPEQTYMVVDDRRDHSFRVPRPDLSATTGAPDACSACHSERSANWASEAIAKHHPTADAPHYGTLITRARAAEPSVEAELATLAEDTTQPGIVRATALSLMTAYDRGWSSDAISNGLRDADPLVRIGALRGANRWPPAKRWQKASALLRDELLAVRVEAARTLANTYAELVPVDQATLRLGLEEYLQTLALNADRAESQSSMASVHLAMGEIPVAENALRTALSLNPQWVPAMVNLADLYRATGRDTQAGPLLDRALEAAPEAADVLLAKGLWLVRQQRAEEALPLLRSATELAPQVQRYAYIYAVALHSLGQSEAALSILDELLEAAGNDRQLLEAAASIARDAGLADRFEAYARRIR
ncbi:MAG: tetratricopeptide repeat protein, partial [Pseudomonadales bacterium]